MNDKRCSIINDIENNSSSSLSCQILVNSLFEILQEKKNSILFFMCSFLSLFYKSCKKIDNKLKVVCILGDNSFDAKQMSPHTRFCPVCFKTIDKTAFIVYII